MSAEATHTAVMTFSASPLGQWMAFVGWIVGFVGTGIGVKTYVDQQRQAAAYRVLLDSAERQWKGEYTEQQVTQLRTELSRLQDAMSRGIPVEAKRAVAVSQMAELQKIIVDSYSRYEGFRATVLEAPAPLPDQVRLSIESELVPLERQRSRQLANVLGALAVGIGLILLQIVWAGDPFSRLHWLMRSYGLFAPADGIMLYLIGVVIVGLLSGGWVIPRLNMFARVHRKLSIIITALAVSAWAGILYWLASSRPGSYPVPYEWAHPFELGLSIFTLGLLWLAVRLFRLLAGMSGAVAD